jgi:hypothetical protein
MSSPVAEQTAGQDIGNARIDPAAEPNVPATGGVTPQQEVDFYKRGGKEYELAHNQQNLGLLGKLFGSNASAPTNIAGLIVVLSFVLYFGSFWIANQTPELTNTRTALLGLVGTALGYIFGSASKKDAD